MDIHGIIPPVATPMQANEDLDLPRLQWFLDHLIAAASTASSSWAPTASSTPWTSARSRRSIATAVAHVNSRVPVYAGTGAETTREAVRLTQDGREGGGRRRVGHHAVLHHARRSRRSSTTTAASPRARRCRWCCTTTPATCGGVKIDAGHGRPAGRDPEHPRRQGLVAATCRTPASTSRSVPRAVQRADGPRHAHLPGAGDGGARGGAGDGQHRPAAAGGDLRGVPRAATWRRRRRRSCGSTRCGWRWTCARRPAAVKAALELLGMSIGPVPLAGVGAVAATARRCGRRSRRRG